MARRRSSPSPTARPSVAGPRIAIPPRVAELAYRASKAAALDRAIDRIREIVPGATIKTARAPESKGFTPWTQIVTIKLPGAFYGEAHDALGAFPVDAIGDRLLARVRMTYAGPSKRGARDRVTREVTIAEITPLDVAIHRARLALDPDDEDSIAGRYTSSQARTLEIWISSARARSI